MESYNEPRVASALHCQFSEKLKKSQIIEASYKDN
uniref:Uncharacterized protein n=1 Tax=Arundo donax TaxID=35708 RepID=A0A0A9EIR0_ARUDO